jgi:hypothetical protein
VNDPPQLTSAAQSKLTLTQDGTTRVDLSGWFVDADTPFKDATGAPLDSLTYAVNEANQPPGQARVGSAWIQPPACSH